MGALEQLGFEGMLVFLIMAPGGDSQVSVLEDGYGGFLGKTESQPRGAEQAGSQWPDHGGMGIAEWSGSEVVIRTIFDIGSDDAECGGRAWH